tara:strand:- start:126 stop:335 length:210 start_codon:yes stop_codon:yes gene_type:complete
MKMIIKRVNAVTYNITNILGGDLQSRLSETNGMWDLYNLTENGYVKKSVSEKALKKFNTHFKQVIKNII